MKRDQQFASTRRKKSPASWPSKSSWSPNSPPDQPAGPCPPSERPVAITQRSSARYRHWPFRCCLTPRRVPRSGIGIWCVGGSGWSGIRRGAQGGRYQVTVIPPGDGRPPPGPDTPPPGHLSHRQGRLTVTHLTGRPREPAPPGAAARQAGAPKFRHGFWQQRSDQHRLTIVPQSPGRKGSSHLRPYVIEQGTFRLDAPTTPRQPSLCMKATRTRSGLW